MAGKKGKKHRLLVYRRAMDQMWGAMVWLGVAMGLMLGLPWLGVLLSMFGLPYIEFMAPLPLYGQIALYVGLALLAICAVFIFITRNMAFVQPNEDHILVATPFLRMRISYKRVIRMRPVHFAQVFTPDKFKGARKRLLGPFAGKTMIVVDLKSLPMSKFLLRMFLLPEMFLPKEPGLIFIVEDWMALSLELDSMMMSAREKVKQARQGQPADGYSLMQSLRKK